MHTQANNHPPKIKPVLHTFLSHLSFNLHNSSVNQKRRQRAHKNTSQHNQPIPIPERLDFNNLTTLEGKDVTKLSHLLHSKHNISPEILFSSNSRSRTLRNSFILGAFDLRRNDSNVIIIINGNFNSNKLTHDQEVTVIFGPSSEDFHDGRTVQCI